MPGLCLAREGLCSGGGPAVVGDLLAGMCTLWGDGMTHCPVCFGVGPGHFCEEGFMGGGAA